MAQGPRAVASMEGVAMLQAGATALVHTPGKPKPAQMRFTLASDGLTLTWDKPTR